MPGAPRQLYFAYGSNLWLQQMAARCPGSQYVGRAVLPDHRWQINERGFANVVPCSGYAVHGLVYAVDGADEARLDRSEGVRAGAYSKAYRAVVLYPAPPALQKQTRRLADHARGGPSPSRPRPRPLVERGARLQHDVLIYMSHDHVRDGAPREEYVGRMNAGIRDAVALAVPADFFDTAVRGYIPEDYGGAAAAAAAAGATPNDAQILPWHRGPRHHQHYYHYHDHDHPPPWGPAVVAVYRRL